MYGVILLLIVALFISFVIPVILDKKDQEEEHSMKYKAQMKKLWGVAQTSMKEMKPLRAEKALLTILKFDEKNAAAYNRLGILYAKEQKYDEAIECFEIAQSLDSNPSSLHNAGLIYLETGSYEKAAMAFEQAIKAEGDVPSRYIALAKAYEKLGNRAGALEALEASYEIDRSTTTLRQILALHEASGDKEAALKTTDRINEEMEALKAKKEEKKVAQKRLMRRSTERRELKPVKFKKPEPRTGLKMPKKTLLKKPSKKKKIM